MKRQRLETELFDIGHAYDANELLQRQDRVFDQIVRQGATPAYLYLRWQDSTGFSTIGPGSGNYQTFTFKLPKNFNGYSRISLMSLFLTNGYTNGGTTGNLAITISEIASPTVTSADLKKGFGLNPLTIPANRLAPPTFIVPNQVWQSGDYPSSTAHFVYEDKDKDTLQANIGGTSLTTMSMMLGNDDLEPLVPTANVLNGTTPFKFYSLWKLY